jgi:hypothetical protein
VFCLTVLQKFKKKSNNKRRDDPEEKGIIVP